MNDGIDFSKIPEGRFNYNVMPRGAGETYYKMVLAKTYYNKEFVWTLYNDYNFKHNVFKLIPSYYNLSKVLYFHESQSVFFSSYCYKRALRNKERAELNHGINLLYGLYGYQYPHSLNSLDYLIR